MNPHNAAEGSLPYSLDVCTQIQLLKVQISLGMCNALSYFILNLDLSEREKWGFFLIHQGCKQESSNKSQ